jgi:Spy/CpxP family protein refolding chaperone
MPFEFEEAMLQSNLVLLSTTALVLGAGVMVGRLSAQLPALQRPAQTTTQERPSRTWPWDQLALSADQRAKMDAIWAQTRQQVEKTFDHRHDMEADRESAILQLLTPEQQAEYSKINSDFHAKREALFDERNKLVHDADDQSRALLDPDQQKKWDMMTKDLKDRGGLGGGLVGQGRGRPGGPGMHGPRDHQDNQDRSTTRPTGSVENNHVGADVTAHEPVGM